MQLILRQLIHTVEVVVPTLPQDDFETLGPYDQSVCWHWMSDDAADNLLDGLEQKIAGDGEGANVTSFKKGKTTGAGDGTMGRVTASTNGRYEWKIDLLGRGKVWATEGWGPGDIIEMQSTLGGQVALVRISK